jgi:predicted nucleotidyltransferase
MMTMRHQGARADRQRIDEAQNAVRSAVVWAEREENVRAVALVGSWARNAARMDSDLDLVILCGRATDLLRRTDWHSVFGAAEVVSVRDFGAIQERRLRRASGFEIEVGVGSISWAAAPPDPGTAAVALDALVPLYDPDGHLRRLLDALTGAVAPTPRLPLLPLARVDRRQQQHDRGPGAGRSEPERRRRRDQAP